MISIGNTTLDTVTLWQVYWICVVWCAVMLTGAFLVDLIGDIKHRKAGGSATYRTMQTWGDIIVLIILTFIPVVNFLIAFTQSFKFLLLPIFDWLARKFSSPIVRIK